MSLVKRTLWSFFFLFGASTWAFGTACHHSECELSVDCPPATGPCLEAGCFDGVCRQVQSHAGTECEAGVCDAEGHCGCTVLPDCAKLGDECNVPSCDQGQCHVAPAPDDTPCRLDDVCGDSICQDGACVTTPLPNGSPCSLGGECAPPATCVNDVCTANNSCEAKGIHETNGTQDTAYSFGTLTDCDELTICDSLLPGEEDWYVYVGDDTECEILATVDVDSPEVEVCQYWDCVQPNISVTTCPPGTTESTAPNGQFGCCGFSDWQIDPCNGDFLDDGSATIWIQIKPRDTPEPPTQCAPYTLYMEF